jgi:hypothetical protein
MNDDLTGASKLSTGAWSLQLLQYGLCSVLYWTQAFCLSLMRL